MVRFGVYPKPVASCGAILAVVALIPLQVKSWIILGQWLL